MNDKKISWVGEFFYINVLVITLTISTFYTNRGLNSIHSFENENQIRDTIIIRCDEFSDIDSLDMVTPKDGVYTLPPPPVFTDSCGAAKNYTQTL